jgi:hypothetical protein
MRLGAEATKGLAFGTRETQGVRQRAHGVRMGSLLSPRSSALTALAVRPALESQPFLRQLGGLARAPEARAEVRGPRSAHSSPDPAWLMRAVLSGSTRTCGIEIPPPTAQP